jgi:hypothetical protein
VLVVVEVVVVAPLRQGLAAVLLGQEVVVVVVAPLRQELAAAPLACQIVLCF